MAAPSKKVIAQNLHIGTNVLVYERWLVLKVWYTAGGLASLKLSPIQTHIADACESKMWKKHSFAHNSFIFFAPKILGEDKTVYS